MKRKDKEKKGEISKCTWRNTDPVHVEEQIKIVEIELQYRSVQTEKAYC